MIRGFLSDPWAGGRFGSLLFGEVGVLRGVEGMVERVREGLGEED